MRLCRCHGVPMLRDGIRKRDGLQTYRCPVRKTAKNAMRVRMRAGGIQFFLGNAPTAEAAQQLRQQIREETPRGLVQDS